MIRMSNDDTDEVMLVRLRHWWYGWGNAGMIEAEQTRIHCIVSTDSLSITDLMLVMFLQNCDLLNINWFYPSGLVHSRSSCQHLVMCVWLVPSDVVLTSGTTWKPIDWHCGISSYWGCFSCRTIQMRTMPIKFQRRSWRSWRDSVWHSLNRWESWSGYAVTFASPHRVWE